ncbi:OmpL47-type beta-barrel domain-containing protein [Brevibacillus dissolubilis]|uniref:OmpL47-type beta-barrel domain-containing protein n=1 Tax=Brevibacillus dissolubilis TaxID=1844116 RepID=UPI0011166DEA|nr:Ig-like domain repeat protein [Brevibacillus dissolubilis]
MVKSRLSFLLTFVLILQMLMPMGNVFADTLPVPTNLASKNTSPDDITLSWDAITGISVYNVYQLTGTEKKLVSQVAATSMNIRNLKEGSYTYAVASYKAGVESELSSSVTVEIVYPEMKAPTGISYTILRGSDVALKWEASQYANSYNVYEWIDGQPKLITTADTSAARTLSRVKEGTHTYSLTSVNTLYGESDHSEQVTVTVDYPDLAAPANVTYTIVNGSDIALKWDAAVNAQTYNVYEITNDESKLLGNTSSTAYTARKLPQGTHVLVVTTVHSTFGESVQSEPVTVELDYPEMQAPTNLQYQIKNGADIAMSWDAVAFAQSYKIYSVVNGENKLLGEVFGVTTYTARKLPQGTYNLVVTSVHPSFGESALSAPLTVELSYPDIQPPADFSYTIVKGNDVKFSWAEVTYTTTYKIYELVNEEYTLVKTVTAPSATNTLTNVAEGKHVYAIAAQSDRFGESLLSEPLTVEVVFPIMQPPTNLTTSVTNGNDLTIKWTESQYVTSYNIYDVTSGSRKLVTNVIAPAVSKRLINLPEGPYKYEVTAVSDRFGESPTASTVSGTMVYPIMEPPVNFKYTIANGNDVTVRWDPALYATSYNIYLVKDGQKTLAGTAEAGTTSKRFAAMAEGTYEYEVSSVSDRFGESAKRSALTVPVVFPDIAAPVLKLTVTDASSVRLSWVAINYATSYNVYEVINGNKVLVRTTTSTSMNLTALTEGTHNYVAVAVSDRFGESPDSNTVTVDVGLAAPTVTAKVSGYNVDLTWSAVTGAASYNVYQVVNGQPTLVKSGVTGTAFTVPNLVPGTYEFQVYAVNSTGKQAVRYGSATATVKVIDVTAPVTTSNIGSDWTKEDVNVTLTATDDLSGVAKTLYTIAGATERQGTTFTVTQEGQTKVTYYSVDNAGNVEAAVVKTVKIDRTAPVTTGKIGENGVINLTAEDTLSGPDKTFYSINGSEYVEGTKVVPTGAGTATVKFYSVDKAGNVEAPVTLEVTLDSTAPVTVADYVKDWTNQDVKVTFTATDEYGVAATYYSVDGGQKQEGTALTISEEGVHQVSFYSVDKSGNTETEQTITVKIDKTFPTTLVEAPQGWVNQDGTITFTAVDELSGVADTFYSIDGGEYVSGTTVSVKEEGRHIISYYSVDKAGNVEAGKSIDVKVDKTAPVTTGNLPKGWSNQDVTVTLEASDATSGVAKTYYTINGSEPKEGTTFTFTEEGIYKVTFYSVDNAGNTEEAVTGEVKIDKVAPVTTADAPQSWINQDGKITFTATDNLSGVAATYYSINGSEYQQGTEANVNEGGIYIIAYYSVDNAGNKEEVQKLEVKVDKAAPVTKGNMPEGWNTTDVTVELTATDDLSGVAKTYYTINDSEPQEGTSFTLTEEGVHKVTFYSVDNAGNVEEAVTGEVKIDKTAPSTTSDATAQWINKEAVINLTATDATSGVAKTYYSVDGAEFVEGTTFTVENDGIHIIAYYSVDVAGNQEEVKKAEVKVDRTAPVTKTTAPTDWSREDVTLTLEASDNLSGVDKTFYSINGGTPVEGTTVVVSEEGINKVTFYSTDKAGNVEEAQTVEVKVDKTAPATTSDATDKWSQTDVTVNLTATDAQSGVAKTYYSINGGQFVEGTTLTVTEEGINKVTFYSVDVAGNKEEAKTVEVKVDKTKPVVEWNLNSTYNYGTKLPIDYTATDAVSGIATETVTINGVVVKKGDTFPLNQTGEYKVVVTVTDNAGWTTTLEKTFKVLVPATIEVTPKVINGNKGVFTVRVTPGSGFNAADIDPSTVTLNGVKPRLDKGTQPKLGQYKFEREDFNWPNGEVVLEFRAKTVNGQEVYGTTTVQAKK